MTWLSTCPSCGAVQETDDTSVLPAKCPCGYGRGLEHRQERGRSPVAEYNPLGEVSVGAEGSDSAPERADKAGSVTRHRHDLPQEALTGKGAPPVSLSIQQPCGPGSALFDFRCRKCGWQGKASQALWEGVTDSYSCPDCGILLDSGCPPDGFISSRLPPRVSHPGLPSDGPASIPSAEPPTPGIGQATVPSPIAQNPLSEPPVSGSSGSGGGFSLAEENEKATRKLVRTAKGDILRIGLLLSESEACGFWSSNGWESFRTYVESLGLGSYSWATRMMGAARLVRDQVLSAESLDEIGLSKVALLLPLAKAGKLTPELVEQAKGAPYADLREIVGRNFVEPSSKEGTMVTCPRCGFEWMLK